MRLQQIKKKIAKTDIGSEFNSLEFEESARNLYVIHKEQRPLYPNKMEHCLI